MNAPIRHNPAEQALIDALEGAEGWRARLREATQRDGLPTRRDELWKYSDLKRAAEGVEAAGVMTLSRPGPAEPADGETVELTAHASKGASAAEFELRVKAGRRAVLIERREADPGAFGQLHLTITLEEGAALERIIVTADEADAVFVASAEIDLAPKARFRQAALAFGGKLVREETHITHPGEGADVSLNAAYLLAEGRHADFTSLVDHVGPGGETHQLVKGAAAAHATGVFQGKFKVRREAQHTDARMTHRALMLDDRAEIDAKPELEIYADDVQCAHGNALGALDETALFYLRQRGLPEAKARALLVESFLAEPLQSISDEAVRDSLLASLRERLGAVS